MLTVDKLLDLAKKAQGIQSDYKLAQLLDATQNTIANYRHGRSRPDDKMLTRLGDLAKASPVEIELLAVQLQAERASTDQAKQLWTRLAARLQAGAAHVAALVTVGLVGIVSTPSAHAVVTSPALKLVRVCILCKVTMARLFRALVRGARATFGGFKGSFHAVQSADTDAAFLNPA